MKQKQEISNGVKIKILGTRGEIEASAPYHSHRSGVLLDNKILLDIGEKEFLEYKPEHILITHLHPDHAFFVRNSESINFSAYAPEKYKYDKKVKVLTKKIKIGPYKITSIPTHHSKKVKSQAYLIEKNNQKILYTGDMIWINKKYHYLLENLDLVITEGSFIRKGGMIRRDKESGDIYGHAGVPNLINLFKKFTGNIVFMHFGSWFYKDIKKAKKQLKELGKEHGMNVIVGYDGLEINLKR